jgi:serine/threonine protein phosphatase PrpC
MRIVGKTHIGNVRNINEDTLLIHCERRPRYMLIADGMGGHAAGEVASRIAAQSIELYIEELDVAVLTERQVLDAIEYTNRRIIEEMEENHHLHGMGTTLTFAYADGNDLLIAQIGDSSAFLYHDGVLKKITKDHTYIQHLIDSGVIEENAEKDYPFKNIITRALGMKKLEIDMYHATWQPGDVLLLCSDGLTAYADQKILRNILSEKGKIQEKVERLVDYALKAGGKDNISVIVAINSSEEELMG